jgi:hypothetical protein
LANSDGSWHETLIGSDPPLDSSDRTFGLLFAGACGVIGSFALWEGRHSAFWWLSACVIFFLLALFAAPLLRPLNRAWRLLALVLSKIVNPIILAIMFFGVLTVLGTLMRLTGKDPLRLRFDKDAPSYWLPRDLPGQPPTPMTKQY